MRFASLALLLTIGLTAPLPAVASSHKHKTTASKTISGKHTTKTKVQSQRGIDDQRATEIQAALIKAGYLSGEPSGHWDASSQNAMQKLQGDNGWQTKLVPDLACPHQTWPRTRPRFCLKHCLYILGKLDR